MSWPAFVSTSLRDHLASHPHRPRRIAPSLSRAERCRWCGGAMTCAWTHELPELGRCRAWLCGGCGWLELEPVHGA